MGHARRTTYRLGALMGDIDAILSGNPMRVVKRLVNKWIGRNIVRRMWWR